MKRLFRFPYPKLTLLLIFSICSYFLFTNDVVQTYVYGLESLSYLGIFIAGLLFSFGFSTPFAIGFFAIASPSNIYLAAVIGGVGALISDLVIFKLIKLSFMDEFRRLENTSVIKKLTHKIHFSVSHRVKNYLLYIFAGIIISSPLPDELGVSMLAGLTHIKIRILAIISFIMNTIGILIILLLARI